MYISQITPLNFGILKVSGSLQKKLVSRDCSNSFKYNYDKVETIMQQILDVKSKSNIDIMLCHSENEGFYGVVSKSGCTSKPSAEIKCKISAEPKDIDKFYNFINHFDTIYNNKDKQ